MNSKLFPIFFLCICIFINPIQAQYVLIPMDLSQEDHLKAYGIAYWTLQKNVNVEWLLNFRGGSFLMQSFPSLEAECLIRGVSIQKISGTLVNQIYTTIEQENMERILLEKAPKIAVYWEEYKQLF